MDPSEKYEKAELLERWRNATTIDFAWFEYGEPRMKRQFREGRGPGPTKAIEMLMIADLFSAISNGELVAYGFRVSPDPSDGPVIIPRHAFDQRAPSDLQSGSLVASGWTYDRLRVLPPVSAEHPTVHEVSDATLIGERPSKRRGGGRTTYYPESRAVLIDLRAKDASNLRLSPEKLCDKFNKRFFEMHPALDGEIAPISPRTLRDHMTRFKMEKTGENWQ
jgi:hypothetical protein